MKAGCWCRPTGGPQSDGGHSRSLALVYGTIFNLTLRLLRRWPSLDGAWRQNYFAAATILPDCSLLQVNSALHPSGVAKSSTSFGWGKGGKVTSAGWQVTLCDLIWHVISRSGVVTSITNCYIRFTLLFFTFTLIVVLEMDFLFRPL